MFYKEDVVAVVKSDAYGFGVKNLATILYEQGCRAFAVSSIYEGIKLRSLLGKEPMILTLNGYNIRESSLYTDYQITPCVGCIAQLEEIPKFHNCWLHIDTGLVRTGIDFQAYKRIKPLVKSKNISVIMSHLCYSSPEFSCNKQLERARELFDYYREYDNSFCKTAGLALNLGDYNHPRIGHGLYFGYDYIGTEDIAIWQSDILQLKDVRAGESIGYNHTYTTNKPISIAMVNCGYSHGLHSEHPYVLINGVKCPRVGTMSMEMITVDVSKVDCDLHTPVYIFYNNWVEIAKGLGVSAGTLSSRINKYSVSLWYN